MGHSPKTPVGRIIAMLFISFVVASPAMAQTEDLGVPSPESYTISLALGGFATAGGAVESRALLGVGLDVDGLWRVSPRFSVNTQLALTASAAIAVSGRSGGPDMRWLNQLAVLPTWRGLGDKWRLGFGLGYTWFNEADWEGLSHGPALVVRGALPALGGRLFAEVAASFMWMYGGDARVPDSVPVLLRLGWSGDVGRW